MPLTPEQIAIIRKKEAAKPEALKRDNLKNYREGYFFITLNTRNESPILSTIEGEVGMPAGSPNAPHCKYTPLGAKVKEMWETIPSFHPTVTIIAAEIIIQLWRCTSKEKRLQIYRSRPHIFFPWAFALCAWL